MCLQVPEMSNRVNKLNIVLQKHKGIQFITMNVCHVSSESEQLTAPY